MAAPATTGSTATRATTTSTVRTATTSCGAATTTITSTAPLYYYTKLGEVKIEMLAEASKDARTRAENMVNSAGGATIGELKSADMGVININPANSTQGSWDGNNDTSSLEKDIITIVHAKYALD